MNVAPPSLLRHRGTGDTLLAELAHWLPVLGRLGFSSATVRAAIDRARTQRTTLKAILLTSGAVSEEQLYEELANEAGLPFLSEIDSTTIVGNEADFLATLGAGSVTLYAPLSGRTIEPTLVVAPNSADLSQAYAVGTDWMGKVRVCLTTPTMLRAALMERAAPELSRLATQGLFESHPQFSARLVMIGWQAFVLGAFLVTVAGLFWLLPVLTFIGFHVASTIFFAGCAGLRTAAALLPRPSPRIAPIDPAAERPVYSILVALYREAEVVPQLLVALSKLQWPRHRLEIKLVCEADDRETLAAIAAHQLRSFVEVIKVPPSSPRTKPKALRYALPATSGEFLVLYDAEDRPHPLQLEEAWRRFSQADEQLACLQAPLTVALQRDSFIGRMFAFEYSGLFRGLLPWLAAFGQVLPLGGTSNHFRRAALDKAGAWDPHNVAEDVDIGLRLARHGYRMGTMVLPTLEAPPEDFAAWRPQRTRWYKGWLQSLLVHMRAPSRLFTDLGAPSFFVAQILLAGVVFSALLHPVVFLTAAALGGAILLGFAVQTWQLVLFGIDIANLILAYLSFWLLGWRSTPPKERTGLGEIALWTPVYWLMQSYAAWLAVFELIRSPHRWNKTPHLPDRQLRELPQEIAG